MAQHYFSFERDTARNWPAAVLEAEDQANWSVGTSNMLSIVSGAALVASMPDQNVWTLLRFPVFSADIEIVGKVRRAAAETTSARTGAGLFLRAPNTGDPRTGGYVFGITSAANNSSSQRRELRVSLQNNVGSQSELGVNGTALTDYASASDRIARAVTIRAKATGDTIQARAWYEGAAEPSTWLTLTRSAAEATGGSCGIVLAGYRSVAEWSFFGVGTDGDSAPTAPVPYSTSLSGKANINTTSGAPVSLVLIIDATTNETYTTATPDESGNWSANVPPGDYYVAYASPDCQPIIHGPYHVEAD
ncbi:hypothetical protein E6C76_20085 [Pseudothauera nasutitermitis]|uniref:Uncharacterized protein n=1 Tax=Pseudothauera nasutitermitis TaxID=2565930 RepID=A0A4S4AQD9_9RHOO|nr:hypothetical protein [Pseudothauera nasutitermitis]THF61387.1 hypothetical protein E6C76_20085 [Pseudothauera nasutitermitis]